MGQKHFCSSGKCKSLGKTLQVVGTPRRDWREELSQRKGTPLWFPGVGQVHSRTKGNGEFSPRSVKKARASRFPSLAKASPSRLGAAPCSGITCSLTQGLCRCPVEPRISRGRLSHRENERRVFCTVRRKPPVLVTPGSGWSAKQTQVPSPVTQKKFLRLSSLT